MSIDRHPATMVGNQQKEEEEEEGRKEGTETQADVTAVIIGICELSSALASRLGWLHHGLAPPRHQPPAYDRNGAYPGSSWAAGGGHRAAR
jgi:hypothetical protein